jgi:hypothetical protein
MLEAVIIAVAMPRLTFPIGLALLVLTLAAGCVTRAQVRPQDAAERLPARTGATARVAGIVPAEVPPGIRIEDGLTADEAVATALWNNAAFQVSVSELGFARADLLEAGLLLNPVLSLLFPAGPSTMPSAARGSTKRGPDMSSCGDERPSSIS